MITIYTELIKYGGNKRIKLKFAYNPELVKSFKVLPDCRWSPMIKSWHIHHIEDHIEYLTKTYNGKYRFVEQETNPRLDNTTGFIVKYQDVPSEDRIYLKFDFDRTIIDLVKTLEQAYWHASLKLWSIKGGKDNYRTLIAALIRKN